MKPDSNFILSITPNYAYGRKQGFTDGETYVLAEEAYSLMQIAEEKQVAKKPIESEFTPLICPDCESKVILGQRYCENCGQRIDWEETP